MSILKMTRQDLSTPRLLKFFIEPTFGFVVSPHVGFEAEVSGIAVVNRPRLECREGRVFRDGMAQRFAPCWQSERMPFSASALSMKRLPTVEVKQPVARPCRTSHFTNHIFGSDCALLRSIATGTVASCRDAAQGRPRSTTSSAAGQAVPMPSTISGAFVAGMTTK